ncbi:MAG: hypothetical protein Q4P11_00045 [Methanobrevibacter sp.]|nr:hypothetical protein [Methanobrevibacter sp.]
MKCENFLKKIKLSNKQKQINKMFEEEGLTDEILKKQLEVNNERNKLDIHDTNEVVYTDDDGNEFVQ